jgi:predicted alpha/beta hydrolase
MIEKRQIRTKDGKWIGITRYIPGNPNGRNIIIAPAAHILQVEYEPFAKHFLQQGYSIVSFDYRGTGESPSLIPKKQKNGLLQWAVHDIDAVIRYVRQLYSHNEIIYIGHGVGGELVGLAPASQFINRLVLIDSALSCKKLWPWHIKLGLFLAKLWWRILGSYQANLPIHKPGLRNRLPREVVYEWINWCEKPNGLFDFFPDCNYRKLAVPLLAISFDKSWYSPEKAVRELLNYFSNSQISWYHIDPAKLGFKKIKNFCFFEPFVESSLWETLKSWLNEEAPVALHRMPPV